MGIFFLSIDNFIFLNIIKISNKKRKKVYSIKIIITYKIHKYKIN